jgi:hypothetical protein
VQPEAALEMAAPSPVERQREQQRIQARSYISPRDPRLQLSGLVNTQLSSTPAQPLLPGSVAAAVSVESEMGQPEGSNRQSPPAQIVGSEGQQGPEERSQWRCSHCGCADPAGRWHRHPTTRALLCSACGQYARANDGRLPNATVLQRRVQQRQAMPPNQRQCMQCGSSTPGAQWYRNPVTKEEWLCSPCYHRAFRPLQRKRQRKAAEKESCRGSGSAGEEESEEESETPAQRRSPPAPQQHAAPVQPPLPGPPVQHRVPATVRADLSAEAGPQQHLQALSQQQRQPKAVNGAAWEPVPEQPALLPAHNQQPQASTGLLVLEAAQQAAAAPAGLTEGLAGTFAALLPMPPEQVRLVRWQRRSRL